MQNKIYLYPTEKTNSIASNCLIDLIVWLSYVNLDLSRDKRQECFPLGCLTQIRISMPVSINQFIDTEQEVNVMP